MVQQQLEDIGITVTLEQVDGATLVDRLFAADYDIVPGAMASASNTPDQLLSNALLGTGPLKSEFTGYNSETMNELVVGVTSTTGDDGSPRRPRWKSSSRGPAVLDPRPVGPRQCHDPAGRCLRTRPVGRPDGIAGLMNARAVASRIGRMTGQALLTISVVVILVFLLVRITPGDPVKVILGTEYSPEDALRRWPNS